MVTPVGGSIQGVALRLLQSKISQLQEILLGELIPADQW